MKDLEIAPIGSSGAVVVRSRSHEPIGCVAESLFGMLDRHGVVLFSGFDIDQQSFTDLVEQLSSRTTFDPSRDFHTRSSQLVNVGNGAIELHCENSNGPWRPDVAWFFCERAARGGGHTTICDGVRLWQELSAETRALFERHNIKYRRIYQPERWKTFLPSLLPGKLSPSEVTVEHLAMAMKTVPGIRYRVLPDESIDAEYECSAVNKTKFGGADAFANSIRGPYGGQTVVLDDGSAIPAEVLDDITRTGDRLTDEIPWTDRALAVVDNTRFLHGRAAFADPRRRIFVALGFV